MSDFASFTVNDRESTPVAHTFVPQEREKGAARFIEPGVVPIANRNYTVSWRTTNGRTRVRLVLADPKVVTETINGVDVTKVPFKNFADVTFTFDENSSEQERKNLVGMFANSLAASVTVIDDTVVGLEAIW